ncbi:MAG: hypothetical protein H7A25_20995 [Leptospiraceae bacterium]|nr:hypothetical protein [Leptospiraceae bacterium]
MQRRGKLFISLVLALTLLSACKKVKSDPELEKLIKAIPDNCDYDIKYAMVKYGTCKNKETDKVSDWIKANGMMKTLSTCAVLFNSEDSKTASLAAHVLYRNVKDNLQGIADAPQSLDTKIVELLMEGLKKNQTYFAFYGSQAIAKLVTIKGIENKFYEIIEAHPESVVKKEGYRYIMQFGRLKTFPKIKELAGKDKDLKLVALSAPRNMYKYTQEEETQVCDWVQGFLQDSDEYVSAEAAKTLATRCKGKYIDEFLKEAEKRASEGKLKAPFSWALTSFTFSCKSFLGSPPTGTEEQCKKKEELKAKITK